MRIKISLTLLIINILVIGNSFGQKIPLVYNVENTGAKFPKPILLDSSKLPTILPLPDPFEWSNGKGRSTKFKDWSHRRAEIGAEIQHYEIGPKPDRPDTITASFSNDTLKVNITVNGKTLTLTSKVTLPSGKGPFPAVIGIGRSSGSLPSNIFSSRNIAQITFNFGQVMAWEQKRGKEPINKLYPDLTYIGAYSAWSWGVSRLIDGLELVQSDLKIDLKHLAITGCSFAGKMALFAGAFDERIALTIAQESGGGGYTAWRVSENLGKVETLGRTSHVWFMENMFQFAKAVPKLPYDHHELMAMVAPRALFVTGNPDFVWLADESGYVASRATQKIYKTLGIPDRFGFSIVAGHPHCQIPESQIPEIGAFVDKFLLGKKNTNTNISTNPYPTVDYLRWTNWWGTGNPIFQSDGQKKTSSGLSGQTNSKTKWVGTWATAPQLVEPGNMPPSPGLTNNSLRQIVRVSIGGDTLRVRFSNELSTSPVILKSVQIAVSSGGSAIDVSTNKELRFNGKPEVTMNAGVVVTSDPIAFKLTPRMDVAITIYYDQTSMTVTGHPGSRTTSYLLAGNTTTQTDFTGAVTTDHWYNIIGIDIKAPSTAACVAILGNSITDGRGSTTNMQNRWPDVFSKSLLKNPGTKNVGVLNLGIGGNCVLSGGLGPTGISRYDRDILNQSGVRWAVIFIGVNDIGGIKTADAATTKTNDLIAAFKQMIVKAHDKNIRIYGATILPFNGNGYYNQYSESCRIEVNKWIRTKGNYDGTIDFDKAMRNPQDTTRLLLPAYQNDGLHPDAAGYKVMGEYIDVNLFTESIK